MAGCAASTHVRFKDEGEGSVTGDDSLQVLSRAAERISRDWDRLLAYQSHLPPTVLGLSRIQKTGTMARRFTMKYVGPVGPFSNCSNTFIRAAPLKNCTDSMNHCSNTLEQ